MKLKPFIAIIILSALMLTMACNLFGVLLPDDAIYQLFESDHGSIEGQIMTTAFPGSLDDTEDETSEEGEEVVLFEDLQETDDLDLTPEEQLNRGTHTYKITGETNVTLGGDGQFDDEGESTHEFTADGVYFTFGVLEPIFFTKVAPNNYSYEDENVSTALRYTSTGYEYDQIGHMGVENYFICTLYD